MVIFSTAHLIVPIFVAHKHVTIAAKKCAYDLPDHVNLIDEALTHRIHENKTVGVLFHTCKRMRRRCNGATISGRVLAKELKGSMLTHSEGVAQVERSFKICTETERGKP